MRTHKEETMGRPRKKVHQANHSDLILAYCRVSTGRQALGLEAQQDALRAELHRMGADPNDPRKVRWLIEGGASGKSLDRPKMREALGMLHRGEASTLMAAKLDRISRSIRDFIELIAASEAQGWRLVITGLHLDTSTATGRFTARMMAEVAQLEREVIAERTSDALQALKANGHRLGTPDHRRIPPEVRAKIVQLRAEGYTYQAICDRLKATGTPTARAKSVWFPSVIQRVIDAATVGV